MIDLTDRKIAFVAGGGKYGSGALTYFMKEPDWNVIICDEDRECQASKLVRTIVELKALGNPSKIRYPLMMVGDAAEALIRFFADGIVPEIIVPCVPVHFAAKVLTGYLASLGLSVQPDARSLTIGFERVPLEEAEFALSENDALALASKMPFNMRCASGCSQPERCPVTGRPLAKAMYELITATLNNTGADIVKVLRSHLLAPNIGGFSGKELRQTVDLCIGKKPCTLALATSCSCHAVANVFKIGT